MPSLIEKVQQLLLTVPQTRCRLTTAEVSRGEIFNEVQFPVSGTVNLVQTTQQRVSVCENKLFTGLNRMPDSSGFYNGTPSNSSAGIRGSTDFRTCQNSFITSSSLSSSRPEYSVGSISQSLG